ncbi:MAG TPA: alpha/beta hydrolase [Usitatibacter sp.]|nr:alpha/beta hydrolase [Usitatibacter sp.]
MDRRPLYIDGSGGAFFGWIHEDPQAAARDTVAVICAPGGYEYTRAHRTLRHLADRFARAGIPALRFDYHGTGNSAGDDSDPDRVAAWIGNIREACLEARAATGRGRVCLVGVRLGATLASLATRQIAVDDLVLWNPCISGKGYVRELQAIAMSVQDPESHADGLLESAGYVMTADTLEAVRRIDLKGTPPVASRVLVLSREDAAPPTAFCEAMAAAHLPVQLVRFAGWQEMMAEHLYTVVPDEALARIVEWAAAGAMPFSQSPPASRPEPRASSLELEVAGEAGPAPLVEDACSFGSDGHLFGVVTRPVGEPSLPAIVMFNAGCVHNVGPNRLSVTLARALGAAGFPSLRFDLEGIGDSVARGAGPENDPYPPSALDDARSAFEFLRDRYGYRDFVALGLCSGAHTSFHAGLQFEDQSIGELILINPLTFYWEEGFDQATQFEDAVAYRKSLRDGSRWKKLLRGDVNLRRLWQVAIGQVLAHARARADELKEIVAPHRASRLARDLRRLAAMRRRMTLFVAESDPGREILMTSARRATSQGLRNGRIRFETIPQADHTFSQMKPRRDLVARLSAHLRGVKAHSHR